MWVVGAIALNAGCIAGLSREVSWGVLAEPEVLFLLVIAFIPITILGYFVGAFTCGFWIVPLCRRCNGSSLKKGDKVTILSGPNRGGVAEVYEITIGQGGQELARLDLGPETKETYMDIFEGYQVLKIKPGEQDVGLDAG